MAQRGRIGVATRSGPVRFGLGILLLAAGLGACWIPFLVVRNLPNASERAGPSSLALVILLVLPLVLGFLAGQRLGVAGAVGGVIGVVVAGAVPILVGDTILHALDPAATPVGSGTEGAAAMVIVGLSIYAPIPVLVAGLVGSLAGARLARGGR
jgi:hypothetical protein